MSVAPVPPVVPGPEAGPVPGSALPAGGAFDLVFTTLPALLRLTCGLVGAGVALAVRTPPVNLALLVATTIVLTGWSVWYALRAWRHGISTGLVVGDVALTTAVCLLIPQLVATEVLPGEGSWVAVLASTSVINAQATAPARWSVPAGLLITVAYTVGARRAGHPGEATAHAATLVVQTGCTAMMTMVMRRRLRRADAGFAGYQQLVRQAVIAHTARAAERQQNWDLHDTVLSTLTMVGLGAVSGPSAALRERAAADLRTLGATGPPQAWGDGPGALDDRLRAVLERMPEVPVTASLESCLVPPRVAGAIADSTAAALSNVARHAPAATAWLRLYRTVGTVVVELVDDGPGFDPATVPVHRYGLRESVRGRMAAVGGRAEIDAAPGRGTRIRLEWPDVQ